MDFQDHFNTILAKLKYLLRKSWILLKLLICKLTKSCLALQGAVSL